MERDHSLLGLRLVMNAHPGARILVSDPNPGMARWLCADVLLEASPGASSVVGVRGAVRYAIWKATGNVHRVQEEGEPYPEAVTDDPIMDVPQGWRTDAGTTYDDGGLWAIQTERVRQIEEKGWTPDHDDRHRNGALVHAAAAYASTYDYVRVNGDLPYISISKASPRWGMGHKLLPRVGAGQHPRETAERARALVHPATPKEYTARVSELAKAGALIAAEIDRLSRQAQKDGAEYEWDWNL